MNCNYILELRDIKKEFSGVEVLHGIDFSVKKGQIHALVGENGAGKSTLMKVVSGFHPYGTYSGQIIIDSKEVRFSNIKDAERAGIEIISQEIELVPQLMVYENVFLGNELSKHGLVDKFSMIDRTERIFERFGFEINANTYLSELGVGQQQMVAIAKALVSDTRILIFDEPTSSLSDAEANKLFEVIRELKAKGVTSIYISHRLNEVMKLSDTITILRDGKTVITDEKTSFNEDRIITYMVGREISNRYPREEHRLGDVVISIRGMTAINKTGKKIVNDVSFDLRSGEIVGIAGLVGSGRSELANCIFGAMPERTSGSIYLHGKQVKIDSCSDAIKNHIGLVTEDRKLDGLVRCLDISDNVSMASLRSYSKHGVIKEHSINESVLDYVARLSIRAPSLSIEVDKLSGGNQQKVCIAKLLMIKPKVLILDEPTRGIDVGAKYEIYMIINKLVKMGVAILIISSELPEVIGISDRILVMKSGRITGELSHKDATPERIMHFATLEEVSNG